MTPRQPSVPNVMLVTAESISEGIPREKRLAGVRAVHFGDELPATAQFCRRPGRGRAGKAAARPESQPQPDRGRRLRRQISPGSRRNYPARRDRKSTRLNSSHGYISYAVFCLKKKKKKSVYDVPGA